MISHNESIRRARPAETHEAEELFHWFRDPFASDMHRRRFMENSGRWWVLNDLYGQVLAAAIAYPVSFKQVYIQGLMPEPTSGTEEDAKDLLAQLIRTYQAQGYKSVNYLKDNQEF
ncbi:MAG: hypothetical protein JNL01_09070 [Bdellovibrionales bacterium]|nr:hypothetical protein [Bdellovibrionales bacterium]